MRHVAYLASQYVWIVIVGVALIIPFLIPSKTSGGPFKSRSQAWDPAAKPGLFVHLSDIHVNYKVLRHNELFEMALGLIQNNLSKPFIALTGDIADNFPKETSPRYGTPQKEDMEIYLGLLKNYSVENLVENAGNHDMFAVLSFTSDESYFAKHKEWTEDEFRVSVVNRTIGEERVYFIVANPYEFPTPHPPLLFWVKPSRRFLDLMEDALESIDEDAHVIILVHYPFDMWKFEGRSRNGRSFKDIIKSGRATLLLAGHMHPDYPWYLHHDGGMEIVGTDLMTHHRFGVVTMDNGRIAYHSVDVLNPDLVFVTNPVNKSGLGPRQVFNEPGELRVMAFTQTEPSFTATVDDTNVPIKCELSDTHYLCTGDISFVEYGFHKFVLNGISSREFEFFVGNETETFTESIYEYGYTEPFLPVLCVVMLFILFLVIPFPISRNYSDVYRKWLLEEDITNNSHWLVTILAGFCTVKMRILSLPLFYQISLMIGGLLPFFCPLILTVVEGHLGGVWLYGHVCDGTNVYYFWGLKMTLIYAGTIFLPLITLYSGLSLDPHWTLIIDLLPCIASIGYNFETTLHYCNESAGPFLSIASPAFVLVPLYFYVTAIVLFVRKRHGYESNIPSIALLGERRASDF